MARLEPRPSDLLLVIDMQRDFLPGGSLALPEGDAVIDPINQLLGRFTNAVATQDWHTPDHVSFASRHGKEAFHEIETDLGTQTLWPDHCVADTPGAELSERLDRRRIQAQIRKGWRRDMDSYSAFFENDHTTPTGLLGYCRDRQLTRIVLCGLAQDVCVAWSAQDARACGFETWLVTDATRGIDEGQTAAAMEDLAARGVKMVTLGEVQG